MQVNIYSIAKREKTLYEPLYKELYKMSSRYAKIEEIELFPKEVQKAHTISPEAAKASYTQIFEPYRKKAYSIVLHPDGKIYNSIEFSKLLSDKMSVNFFIGGAYGFNDDFVRACDKAVSLSALTMSHKVAKAVLLEQIYRAFTILNGHPYHK